MLSKAPVSTAALMGVDSTPAKIKTFFKVCVFLWVFLLFLGLRIAVNNNVIGFIHLRKRLQGEL